MSYPDYACPAPGKVTMCIFTGVAFFYTGIARKRAESRASGSFSGLWVEGVKDEKPEKLFGVVDILQSGRLGSKVVLLCGLF